MDNKKYYIGLDIGTDSVGYAAVDERYNLCKFKGEPMWGSHLFDAANQCDERRGYRTARRRLDRRQQRVALVDEIFAGEIEKVDPRFFIRKKESRLWKCDKSNINDIYLFFNDKNYSDKDYYAKFPTIHHLICYLMNCAEKPDIRLVNIALDWLVAHRGHFLSEISPENVDKVTDFAGIYQEFIEYYEAQDIEKPWDNVDANSFGEILKAKVGVNRKNSMFAELLFGGKVPNEKKALVKFLAGGKVKCKDLFPESEYEDDFSLCISDEMDVVLPQLGDNADLVARMAAMYDWALLSEILKNNKYISESKINIYDKHKADLNELKDFVNKYLPEKYKEIFVKSEAKLANYVAYSYNTKWVRKGESLPDGKCSKEEFYKFLKKTLDLDKLVVEDEEDAEFLQKLKSELENGTFMPKQVDSDNRVIPYQVYYVEYKKILDNVSKFYGFLFEKDRDGYSNYEKLDSIFTFKIPYYVGPLRKDKEKYSWLERKAEGKIYPWNFNEKVDRDKSEQQFINRMTNTCTYIPGKDVLPKWSLLYSKYTVLNEINNIKANGVVISVEAKQGIYNELFCNKVRVTPKTIKEYLCCNGFIQKDDTITGLDETVKSSLKAQCEFRILLEKGILSHDDIEKIVERSTYTEDKNRFKEWVKDTFEQLSEEDYKYVSKLKYNDFGRLSSFFLNELQGICKETGEIGTIIHFLWTTNDNLMRLLSSDYTFMAEINKIRKEYYSNHKMTIAEQLENMGISNAVKRPVIRTLDVVDDVVKAIGYPPKKIFIEMARGPEEKKRSVTRKEQILALYAKVDEDTVELEKQLEDMGESANNKLQRDELFLYYMQLGICMYSGEPIDIAQLGTTKYNIDHIYPQSLVTDDSIINNKVLVKSEINGTKGSELLDSSIRQKMYPTWKHYLEKGLISKEKFARLTRNKPFSEDEKWGFINRQLVETRQSTKAVTQILSSIYTDTEIVFVKARLASEFRHAFLTKKSRLINDLHHAKDAYLNAVVGNVYNERFTKKWFNINEKYTVNVEKMFKHDVKHGDEIIWSVTQDMPKVKAVFEKNNIHVTRYAMCKKGGLFDQMPVKAGDNLTPLKAGLDTQKYGGYNKASACFFILARYDKDKKKEVSFVPIELMVRDKFINDDDFAKEYVKDFLQSLGKSEIDNVELLLDKRVIKIKTLISLDGFLVWLNGKGNGGRIILLSNAMTLKLPGEHEEYVKALENYSEKKAANKNIMHDETYDGLSTEKNILLYDTLLDKMINSIFKLMPGNQSGVFEQGREKFSKLDFDEQVALLLIIIGSMKTGRTGAIDLRRIGGKSAMGAMYMNVNISASKYESIKIIDISPAGLHTKESINLKELL